MGPKKRKAPFPVPAAKAKAAAEQKNSFLDQISDTSSEEEEEDEDEKPSPPPPPKKIKLTRTPPPMVVRKEVMPSKTPQVVTNEAKLRKCRVVLQDVFKSEDVRIRKWLLGIEIRNLEQKAEAREPEIVGMERVETGSQKDLKSVKKDAVVADDQPKKEAAETVTAKKIGKTFIDVRAQHKPNKNDVSIPVDKEKNEATKSTKTVGDTCTDDDEIVDVVNVGPEKKAEVIATLGP